MIVIGIVGAPAGGKSTVAAFLEESGATWINADLIAREVLERSETQAELLRYFGPDIADKSGRVDRAKLAHRVFGDDESQRSGLNYLEGLIHPQTRQLIQQRLCEIDRNFSTAADSSGSNVPIVVLDVPLLFEVGWDRCCDQVWYVDTPSEFRLRWANERGWDRDELQRRERNQLPIQEKRQLSSVVIDNHGSLENLRATISDLWSSIIEAAGFAVDDGQCDPNQRWMPND